LIFRYRYSKLFDFDYFIVLTDMSEKKRAE
jgi:hypothetical protein